MDIQALIQQLVPHWHYKASGASEAALNDVQAHMSIILPDDYRTFLKWSNGGTGVLPSMDARKIEVAIWPAEKIVEMNRGYEVQRYLGPQLVAFGDNGGDHHFVLDFRGSEKSPTIAAVPGGDLCDDSIKQLAGSFLEFMEKAWSGKIDEAMI
jgi:hypothetical protein